jgi:hypothetical protein
MSKTPSKIKAFFTRRYTLYTIFWGYNILYLGFIGFSSLTLIKGFFFAQDFLPWNVAIMLYILLLVPISAVWFGLFTQAKREPRKLIAFLFAVEIPIVFLSLIRLFFIRQMTGILWLFFLSLFVSMAGLIIFFVRKKIKTLAGRIAIFLSQEVAVMIGLYLSLLALFFLPIIIALLVRGLVEIDFGDILYALVQTKGLAFFSFLFFLLLFSATAGFLIITPIVAFVIYWRSFISNKRALIDEYKFKYTKQLQYAFGCFYIVAGILLAIQWHGNSYNAGIANYIEATSFEEQQKYAADLINHDKSLQEILLNEYIAPYRFLTDESMNILARGYTKQLNVPESAASGIQSFFNVVALPFVYQSDFKADTERAKEQYTKLFDVPLQEGEKDELVDAMKATNTEDELKAGILDEENKTVRLLSRTVKATTEQNGMFARVSVEEEYENTSDDIQEVYYEFSLPEDAVITGLWLGPKLEEIGAIAPKGAARRTYEQQVTRRVDPALLEQTGPRQYRLRVFPIPVEPNNIDRLRDNREQTDEPNQRVKFEYVTFVSPKGIELPVISTRRNIYEDRKSVVEYFINGQKKNNFASSVSHCNDKMFTIETSIGALTFIPHHLNQSLRGYNCDILKFDSFPNIQGKKLAFLFDSSYSSEQRDWSIYLKEHLPINTLSENNAIDGYFFGTQLSQPIKLTPDRLESKLSSIHFGGTDRFKALQLLPGGYDAIVMFTDESDSDIEHQNMLNYPDKTPIYIVHDTNLLSQYHDALTLTVIRSGGAIFSDPEDAFELIALKQNAQNSQGSVLSVDRYGSWMLSEGSVNLTGNNDDLIAHKQAINQMIKSGSSELEQIHQIAITHGLVSPYSSYIALVTDRQKQQLENESKKDDKFDADYDVGEESISDPSMSGALNLGAVPEPEEWALIISAVILLGYFYRRELSRLVFQKR